MDPPYIVLGVDGSPSSEPAVDSAFDLAGERRAALRVLWVRQRPPVGNLDEHATEQILRRLLFESTAGRHDRHPDVTVTHELVRGHPVEELALASEHALAVVVGRRGNGGFTGMRLGSVPHGLLHHAHCPVVTVPGHPWWRCPPGGTIGTERPTSAVPLRGNAGDDERWRPCTP